MKIETSHYWFWTSSKFGVGSVAVSGSYCCQDCSVVATSGAEVASDAASFARTAADDLTNSH